MQDIEIRGVQKTSLLDYPGKVCTVVFLNRCNFRCPFCHNAELVLGEIKEDIPSEEIFDFLDKKRKWLDGVCITGGEPTLHKGLKAFIERIKAKGLLVKLDTNGTNSKMLKELINKKLVDYVSMDIKADQEGYEKAAGAKVSMSQIQESVMILMNSGIEYEFRTTVVPGLFNEKSAENIAKWLSGAKRFYLQQFRNTDKVLDKNYQNIGHYHIPKLEEFKEIIQKTIGKVEIRGI
jgi:pyruvate formate lyase activating enzyme